MWGPEAMFLEGVRGLSPLKLETISSLRYKNNPSHLAICCRANTQHVHLTVLYTVCFLEAVSWAKTKINQLSTHYTLLKQTPMKKTAHTTALFSVR